MGSLRAGRAFNALSSGLNLFAEKSMQEERDRVSKEWQLSLENLRADRADARHRAGLEHSQAMAKESNRAAQERADKSAAATADFRGKQLEQRNSEFNRSMVANARENLSGNLLKLDQSMQKELENIFDPDEKGRVAQRYQQLKDDAIISTVSWLSSQDLPGFKVDSKESLQSTLTQMGMDAAGARLASSQLWQQGTGEDLIATDQASTPSYEERQSQYQSMLQSGQISEGGAPASGTAAPNIPAQSAQGAGLFDAAPQTGIGDTSPFESGPSLFDKFSNSPFLNMDKRAENTRLVEDWRRRNQ